MRKKRIVSGLLGVFMLVCTALSVNAAATGLELYAPEGPVRKGDAFSVTVFITENPGFAAMQMTLLYNSENLCCTEVKPGALLRQMLTATNTLTEEARPGASITAVGLNPAKGDGLLAEFSFTVLAEGETGLELSYIELGDLDGADISYTLTRRNYKDAPPAGGNQAGIPEVSGDEPPAQTATPFIDVPTDHWASAYVARAAEEGLIYGYADGSFRPNDPVTRGQFVSMLWRTADCPEPSGEPAFADVAPDAWYAKAVAWAAENGYVSGVGSGKFDPGGHVTREQVMTVLFRYRGGKSGMETFLSNDYDARFKDSGTISDWAKNGVYWAVYNGIVSGVTANTLAPGSTASRVQLVVILLRYSEMT